MLERNNPKLKFWDFALRGKSQIFHPKEDTFFKKVPGGWLMRHLFFRGKKYTRSSILFIPDRDLAWQDEEADIEWASVNIKSTPNSKIFLHRLKAPEGWAVKELLTTKSAAGSDGTYDLTLAYIPDPDHQWALEKGEIERGQN